MSLKLPAISVSTWADDEEEGDEDEEEEEEEQEHDKTAKESWRKPVPTPRGSAVMSGLRGRLYGSQQVTCRAETALPLCALRVTEYSASVSSLSGGLHAWLAAGMLAELRDFAAFLPCERHSILFMRNLVARREHAYT